MNNPLVSILSLSYNHEKYLPDFFESILNQTYRPIELVLCNDCSPDNSEPIIQNYLPKLTKNNISYIYLVPGGNQGFFKSFDMVREATSGEYIATLETDDYYLPTKIEESVKFLQNNPQFGAMATDINSLWEDGRYEEYSWRRMGINQNGNEIPYPYLLQDNRIYTCTAVYKTSIFNKSPLDSEWEKSGYKMGDYPRALWIGRRHKIGYLDKNLSTYRIHGKSASHNPETYAAFVASYLQIKEDAKAGKI